LQSHLYLFCNHTAIKLQSRTWLCSATVFFLQSQHIRGQGCLQSPVFFTKLQPHQEKTKLVTSSFFTSFLQSQNHTAIRGVQSHCDMICNQLHSVMQLSFHLQSQHISRCKRTAKDVAITSIFGPGCNPSSKDHPSFNNTVSWHGAFFWNWCFFYPCFFETVFFFAKSLL
jgi:hypothetical protein